MLTTLLLVLAITEVESLKVTILGAGINGAACAFFLKEALGDNVTITVMEKAGEVGGRIQSTVVDGHRVELGASVWHRVNEYMEHFVERLQLRTSHPYKDAKVALYGPDGVVFAEHERFNWLSTVSALWRWGLSPLRAQHAVEDLVSRLVNIYPLQRKGKYWESGEELLQAVGLLEMTHTTIEEHLKQKGVSERFINELTYAFGKINYGQDLELSALAGAVAMKGGGDQVFSVDGGNRRIVEGLLAKAKAKIAVKSFAPEFEELDNLDNCGLTSSVDADVVILSFPTPKHSKYTAKVTHVSFVKGRINRHFFGYSSVDVMPSIIIPVKGVEWGLRHLGLLRGSSDVYKIFSDTKLDPTRLFGEEQPFLNGDVLHTRRWEAYPTLRPRVEGESHKFRLHGGCAGKFPRVFHSGALEYAISTMETQAIAAMNTVNMIVDEFRLNQRSKENVEDRTDL